MTNNITYKLSSSLLTTNNAKTIKGEKLGFTTYILYLSPHRQNSKNINLCPHASEGCAKACLFNSGRGGFDTTRNARINKTEFFLSKRELFLDTLFVEISTAAFKHELTGTKFVVRLNGTSDISWEKFKLKRTGKNIFESLPGVQFYDYTKNHTRFGKELPANYSLVFSRSEDNEDKAMELIARGINVAIVFDELPKKYKGYKVINGDEHDLRFTDELGVVVGLKYKQLRNKNANNKTGLEAGFVVKNAA